MTTTVSTAQITAWNAAIAALQSQQTTNTDNASASNANLQVQIEAFQAKIAAAAPPSNPT